jgi:hypothetical protein
MSLSCKIDVQIGLNVENECQTGAFMLKIDLKWHLKCGIISIKTVCFGKNLVKTLDFTGSVFGS